MFLRSLVACLSLSAALAPSAVYAADAASCAKPHFSDVGWTDITATTQIANQILTSLGYKPNITVLSVAVTFQSLENGDIDVFLGNWMPLQEPSQAPLVKAGKIDIAANNLTDARIGFATSKAAYDSGLKTYADIAKFKDQLDGKLYGIEPGSGANGTISKMICGQHVRSQRLQIGRIQRTGDACRNCAPDQGRQARRFLRLAAAPDECRPADGLPD